MAHCMAHRMAVTGCLNSSLRRCSTRAAWREKSARWIRVRCHFHPCHPLRPSQLQYNAIARVVSAEFKFKYEEDFMRAHRIAGHTCRDGHPLRRFAVGNEKTLRDDPKGQGLDIREELIKFYKATYSSNLMRLVIYGKG